MLEHAPARSLSLRNSRLPSARPRVTGFVLPLLALTLLAACTVKNLPQAGPDGGAAAPDGSGVVVACAPGTPAESRPNAKECMCNEQCGSGNCVDGICCSSACQGSCESCTLPGQVGTCSSVPEGQKPSKVEACPVGAVDQCGLDGTCNGSGQCRKYPDNTVCAAGTCEGNVVTGSKVCAQGRCTPSANITCAPFTCDATKSKCFLECTADSQCASGQKCANGSCGKLPIGGRCSQATQCQSGQCVDGFCCDSGCKGACLTCKAAGNEGFCVAEKANVADGDCTKEEERTCGLSGLCNGQGGCARYAPGTTCQAAVCAGASVMPEGRCNTQGNCVAGAALTCAPFTCTNGACKTTCIGNDDCIAPKLCVGGSCGLRGAGQECQAASQCESGFCADGVCCNEGCKGQCRSCALPTSTGLCVNVPANTPDPRVVKGITDATQICRDQGAASCGANGMCNGAGGCALYSPGTVCKAGSCDQTSNSSVAASTCNGAGTCQSPAPVSCTPFRCSGSRCASICGGSSECAAGNVCAGGSCGKKNNGQSCGNGSECLSGQCAQGICCSTACDKGCFSCAIPGKEGMCSAVSAGALDPKGLCRDTGSASCGTDGTCNGSGSCRLYNSTTLCKGQSCANGIATAASFCSGTGICIAGMTRHCDPYVCNASATACFDSCATAAECLAPLACSAGQCGKKGLGATCSAGSDCVSGQCADGVCCDEACTGLCKTCTRSGSVGVCSNVPAGEADSQNSCPALSSDPCGNRGTCDGSGACSKWGPETTCSLMSCPAGASVVTNPGSCNGQGTCLAGSQQSCGNFLCNASSNTCKTTCTPESQAADCKAGITCVDLNGNNSCGAKPQGAACAATSECTAGLSCVDGTCCGAASCGTCQTCKNVQGVCANVVDGAQDLDSCTSDTTNVCGTVGICNGSGGCKQAPQGTVCGASSCTAAGLEAAMSCNGAGACTQATMPCPNYFRCVGTACKTTCDTSTDCATGADCAGRSGKCKPAN